MLNHRTLIEDCVQADAIDINEDITNAKRMFPSSQRFNH